MVTDEYSARSHTPQTMSSTPLVTIKEYEKKKLFRYNVS